MLTPSEVWGREVETDCTPESSKNATLLDWCVARNNSKLLVCSTNKIERILFQMFLHSFVILHKFETSFHIPEPGYEIIYTYWELHKEGEVVVYSEHTSRLV